MAELQRLANFCRTNDLPWNGRVSERFSTYLEILAHFNQSMNLIGPLSDAEIVDQLFIDSLTPAALHPPAGHLRHLLDVGTGAGFPGLPLKILYPDCPVTLVEPRKKRSTFLKIARTRLDLEGIDIERCRIEELDEPAAGYGYCISKAFRDPVDWLEAARPFVADGGVVVCMTRPDRREAIEPKAEELGLEWVTGVDDVTELEAPAVNPGSGARAVYVIGAS